MNRATAPRFKSRELKRNSPTRNIVDTQPVAGGSKTASSPTILRDESNRIKILGGCKESFNSAKEFPLTSSDTDDTDYNPTVGISDPRRRRSVDGTSSLRIEDADGKKKVFEKRKKIISPLRDSDISEEDGEVRKVSRNDRRTVRQSEWKRKSDNNDHTSTTSVNTSRAINNGRNTVVSSTRTSDDVISISNSDSDLLSEDEVASSASSCRTVCPPVCPAKTNSTVHRAQRKRPLTRNYLPWEQRQMVKYLIDNRLISEAKGNRVWKQMIADGYLTHRTVLSLNNHFRKLILPKIHRYPMEPEHMRKFKQL